MGSLASGEEKIVLEVTQTQLEHFTNAAPHCRALQLPEGIILRYTLSHALYFYLRTEVSDGKMKTIVFSSDSPYDWQKARIGEVSTPMFEAQADLIHLRKLEKLLRSWVEFIQDDPDSASDFKSFELGYRNGLG
jgi:hypothetical protein